jgi:hypothetical protein
MRSKEKATNRRPSANSSIESRRILQLGTIEFVARSGTATWSAWPGRHDGDLAITRDRRVDLAGEGVAVDSAFLGIVCSECK